MVLIGKKIKELRNKFKYTQTELANKVGVTKSTIAAYENDSRLPSYDVLIKMSIVFKVSIDSLLLNRYENVLDAEGLTIEQMDILSNLIADFRKKNVLEDFLSECSPELKDTANHYINSKIKVNK